MHQEPLLYTRIGSIITPLQGTLFLRQGVDIEIIVQEDAVSQIRWFIAVPEPKDYSNLLPGRSRSFVQPIEYRSREIVELRGRDRFRVNDVPNVTALGTHELLVAAGDRELHFQVVIRRNDSYVGFATELVGVPFVYAPGMTPEGHQTDLRKGADCIAMIVYAKRRQGVRVPYFAPPKLYDYVTKIGNRDQSGIPPILEGDILHFGFQTAIVAEDLPPKGRLNGDDIILHTYHGVAETVRFSQLPYRDAHYDILRWSSQSTD